MNACIVLILGMIICIFAVAIMAAGQMLLFLHDSACSEGHGVPPFYKFVHPYQPPALLSKAFLPGLDQALCCILLNM